MTLEQAQIFDDIGNFLRIMQQLLLKLQAKVNFTPYVPI